MTIDDVYKAFLFFANKSTVGYFSPESFNLLFKISQDEYFNSLISDMEGWRNVGQDGKRYPGDTQPITERLAPFKVGPTLVSIDASGNMVRPVNLVKLDAMYKVVDLDTITPLRRVEEDRLHSYVSSVIDPIADNPIYVEYASFYRVYPASLGSATISYYRLPADAKWGYTMSSGRPVYDPGTSVQPEWSDDDIMKILLRMCRAAGIRIKDQELLAFPNIVNNQGE